MNFEALMLAALLGVVVAGFVGVSLGIGAAHRDADRRPSRRKDWWNFPVTRRR